ncbi:glycine--tRNA ligase subunit beta [Candidatus Avelusimicrobium luingense]|uniref:glycine--tRNA ligase subunit beta n=1 Tax=Candidatus Avelusimicrobium luingense TaxID=3416211 RepID=UPI003D0F7677
MNALLEIGVEHLPARFMKPALAQLEKLAADLLTEKRISYERINAFGTYRRLVVEIVNIADKSADVQKEVKGPPAKLLKDANGNFTPQSAGFAQKNGIAPEKLTVVETDKGPFIYAKVKIKGEKTAKLLPEIFTRLVTGLEFAKNMIWEESGLRYGRPIRSLIGLYGNKVIKFTVAGVTSNRNTYPLSSFGRKPIKVATADAKVYAELLRNQPQPVLVIPQERKDALIKTVSNEAKVRGYQADLDESLVEETVWFTEHPVAVSGDFEIKFLTLPKELITTVLKKQIKMFPVLNNKGELQPYFIAVRDGISVNQNEVQGGFKKVMSARLSDAVFFFENDKKEGLEIFKNKLKNISFLEGLGSMYEKSQRTQQLALWLCEKTNQTALKDTVDYAASHAYADLASHVVYEFPELQGYMGGQYAALEGHKDAAKAMEEFYYPLTSTSVLPSDKAGQLVSLAGKIDTLVGNFLIGQIPTGSEDPFALRRQAFGAVRILLEGAFPVSLKELVEKSLSLYPAQTADKGTKELPAFLKARVALVLEQRGHQPGVLDGVSDWYEMPLTQVEALVSALETVKTDAAFAAVLEAAKRVNNILKKADGVSAQIDVSRFELPAEKMLFETVQQVEKQMAALPQTTDKNGYLSRLKTCTAFQAPLETFFKEVMVNAEDVAVRNNRLALLARVRTCLAQTGADITRL